MAAVPTMSDPLGKQWLYEPKYDGFRCLAFRDGDKIDLQSKKQKSLNRFFPEVAAGLASAASDSVRDPKSDLAPPAPERSK